MCVITANSRITFAQPVLISQGDRWTDGGGEGEKKERRRTDSERKTRRRSSDKLLSGEAIRKSR